MTTPTPRWTAETEELVARATSEHWIVNGRTDANGNSPCICNRWWDSDQGPGWDEHMAEVVLTALADAGVLIPVGGETRQEWGINLGDYIGRPFPTRERAEAEIAERRELGRTFPGEVHQRTVHTGPWREATDGG